MLYVLAILLPPVAMFLCGNVMQAILCLVLICTLIGWPIAAIWAMFVVMEHKADKRAERMAKVIAAARS